MIKMINNISNSSNSNNSNVTRTMMRMRMIYWMATPPLSRHQGAIRSRSNTTTNNTDIGNTHTQNTIEDHGQCHKHFVLEEDIPYHNNNINNSYYHHHRRYRQWRHVLFGTVMTVIWMKKVTSPMMSRHNYNKYRQEILLGSMLLLLVVVKTEIHDDNNNNNNKNPRPHQLQTASTKMSRSMRKKTMN
jgi:hypothetical protein